jgi:hypothetical protein
MYNECKYVYCIQIKKKNSIKKYKIVNMYMYKWRKYNIMT